MREERHLALLRGNGSGPLLCRLSCGAYSPQHTHTHTHTHVYGTDLAAAFRGPGGRYRKQGGTWELRGWE